MEENGGKNKKWPKLRNRGCRRNEKSRTMEMDEINCRVRFSSWARQISGKLLFAELGYHLVTVWESAIMFPPGWLADW